MKQEITKIQHNQSPYFYVSQAFSNYLQATKTFSNIYSKYKQNTLEYEDVNIVTQEPDRSHLLGGIFYKTKESTHKLQKIDSFNLHQELLADAIDKQMSKVFHDMRIIRQTLCPPPSKRYLQHNQYCSDDNTDLCIEDEIQQLIQDAKEESSKDLELHLNKIKPYFPKALEHFESLIIPIQDKTIVCNMLADNYDNMEIVYNILKENNYSQTRLTNNKEEIFQKAIQKRRETGFPQLARTLEEKLKTFKD